MPKILVIEDEISLREDIIELLNAENFEAIGAENGQLGVQLAQEVLPDLIICDVLMPQLDGHGVLSILRNDPATALIPFIFLTAKGTTDDFRQGMNLGADDYLTKPYRRAELLESVASRLNKQEAVLELQQTIEELQKSNLLKDEFLSVVSNELRGPVNNISMALKMLQNAPTREKQQRYIELLQAESSREIGLINDLLELQWLKTNSRPLRLELLLLQEWIPTLVEAQRTQARDRQQTIQINIPPYLPSLLVDQTDLKRILTELLTNARKYSAPKGKLVLEIYRASVALSAGATPTTFLVSNETSISSEFLPHLFDEFYRVPGGDRWQQGGSGLGLALVKKLVDRLHGTIQITSEGGWTQAAVQLPLAVSGD